MCLILLDVLGPDIKMGVTVMLIMNLSAPKAMTIREMIVRKYVVMESDM